MISPQRRLQRVKVSRLKDDQTQSRTDVVTTEEPLEIRIGVPDGGQNSDTEHLDAEHSVSVTMRTPGDDFELAAGFLFTEGILKDRSELSDLRYCQDVEEQHYNIVTARLTDPASFDSALLNRNFYMTSSCGVCGKASLEAVEVQGCVRLPEGGQVEGEVLRASLEILREAQAVFERTGGIHAAGLFEFDGTLKCLREDVGRHNAVDKVIGHEFLNGTLPLDNHFLLVSGRSSFEIVQKAVMAGIPMVAAVGAPSSLAVDLARRFNSTLIGFLKADSFNVYTGERRVSGLED